MATTYVRNANGEFELVGPGSANTDTTLSMAGKPADAAAVGSALSGCSKTTHTHSQYALASDIPTRTSDLVNDSGFKTNEYYIATSSTNGLMSSEDRVKLDGITASADAVSFTRSLTSGTKVGTITINGAGTDLYAPSKAGISKIVTYEAGTTATSYSFTASNYDVMMLGLTPSTSGAICCVSIPAALASSNLNFQVADESNYCKWQLSTSGLSRVNGTGNIRYIYGVKY